MHTTGGPALPSFPRILSALLLATTLVAGAAAAPAVPTVHFVVGAPSLQDDARRCAGIWQEEGPELARLLLPPTAAVDTVVCLVLDTPAFRQRFGNALPDWGVGVALPHGRVVAVDPTRLPAVGRGLREVFLHEMVHALLFQATDGAWLPAWFHEGCAMSLAGEWRFSDTVSLALEGRVPDLDRLAGRFPGAAAPADRAYRTSLLAVTWLGERHGPDAVPRIIAATAAHGDFEAGFTEATGEPPLEFSRAFAGRMRMRFGWLVMLTRWPTLFVLLAVVLTAGAVARIVRSRRRLAAMADEEARDGG